MIVSQPAATGKGGRCHAALSPSIAALLPGRLVTPTAAELGPDVKRLVHDLQHGQRQAGHGRGDGQDESQQVQFVTGHGSTIAGEYGLALVEFRQFRSFAPSYATLL